MVAVKRKQSARRLKIEKLRGEGLSQAAIAKRLRVSIKTIKRDVAILNDEVQLEPAYTQERLKLREEFVQRYAEELMEIKKDLDAARQGSQTLEETERPLKAGEVKSIKDPQQLLDASLGAKQIEITKKVFGPDWKAVAQLHGRVLECILNWAKLFGLHIERENRITATEERTVVTGRAIFPEKSSIKEWEALVEAHRQGIKPGVLTEEEVEAAAAQGVKLMEWDPEEGAFVPAKAKGK